MPILFLIIWIACMWIASAVAPRDRQALGFWLGFLFGPFGILIAAVLRPESPVIIREKIIHHYDEDLPDGILPSAGDMPIPDDRLPPSPPGVLQVAFRETTPVPPPPLIVYEPADRRMKMAVTFVVVGSAAVLLLMGIVFIRWMARNMPEEQVAAKPLAAKVSTEKPKLTQADKLSAAASQSVVDLIPATAQTLPEIPKAIQPRENAAAPQEPEEPAFTDWRTWTDSKDRKIKAKWRGMIGGKVKLETRSGGAVYMLPTQFSAKDQDAIREWVDVAKAKAKTR